MVDIQTISIAIASAGVFVAAVYYVFQIRHQVRMRKTDLVMKLYSTFTSKEFTDAEQDVLALQFTDFEDFRKKYGPRFSQEIRETSKSTTVVLGFYELVGTLLYRKLIELVLVYDVFGSSNVKDMFEKVKPLILGLRSERNNPLEFTGFEYLCNEIKRKEPQLRKTWAKASFPTASDSNLPTESSR